MTLAFWALPDSIVMLLRSCHQQHHAALDALLSAHDDLLPSLADNGAMKQLKQDLRELGLGTLADAINDGEIGADQAVDTLHASIFQQLAAELRAPSAI